MIIICSSAKPSDRALPVNRSPGTFTTTTTNNNNNNNIYNTNNSYY